MSGETVTFLLEDLSSQSQSNSFGHMTFTTKKIYYSVTGDYTEHSDTCLAVLQYQTTILVSVALLDDLLSNKVSWNSECVQILKI